jgi:hypothetical protein
MRGAGDPPSGSRCVRGGRRRRAGVGASQATNPTASRMRSRPVWKAYRGRITENARRAAAEARRRIAALSLREASAIARGRSPRVLLVAQNDTLVARSQVGSNRLGEIRASRLGSRAHDQPPPPRPRRQPPDQRDHPPHRRHAPALLPRNPGLHRPQTRRGQEHQRSHPLPQTSPDAPSLAPARRGRPTPSRTAPPINLLDIGAAKGEAALKADRCPSPRISVVLAIA